MRRRTWVLIIALLFLAVVPQVGASAYCKYHGYDGAADTFVSGRRDCFIDGSNSRTHVELRDVSATDLRDVHQMNEQR